MNIRVVTISRQVGTDGEEIARGIAERLGFALIDYQVVQQASQEAGVSPEAVSEAERTPTLATRVLEALARNPALPVAAWADPLPLSASPLYTSTDYRRFVDATVRDLARQGQCVLLGHAAQVILRERFDTLKVLISGSLKYRCRRIMAGMAVDERTATKIAERTDNERREYFQRFYESGWLAPSNYDLCVSTDHVSVSQAVALIEAAARER